MKTKRTKQDPAEELLTEFNSALQNWQKQSRVEHKKQREDSPNVFSMSQLGTCAAKQTFEWRNKNKTEEVSLESCQRMYDGETTHINVRNLLDRYGGDNIDLGVCNKSRREAQVKKTFLMGGKKVTLVGHIDDVVTLRSGNWIVDWKKAERNWFDSIQERGLPDEYKLQILCYCMCAPESWSIAGGIVFIKPTHGVSPQIYIFPKPSNTESQRIKTSILSRLKLIAIHKRKGTIGLREGTYGKFPCSHCPYSTECWGLRAGMDNIQTGAVEIKSKPLVRELEIGLLTSIQRKATEKTIAELKAKERAIALNILAHTNSKKAFSGTRTVGWTEYLKYGVQLTQPAKAVQLGLAKETKAEISFPVFSEKKK